MDIQFNKKGVPLLMFSSHLFADTYADRATMSDRRRVLFPYEDTRRDIVWAGDRRVVAWGADNQWPTKAVGLVRDTTVLNTGLKYLRNLTLGQGVFACTVEGFDSNGDEILQPLRDQRVNRFVQSRNARRYMEKVLRDYLKTGCGAVQFVPNMRGTDIVGLQPLNCTQFRFTVPDSMGNSECVVSGNWNYAATTEYTVLPLLNEYSPAPQAEVLKNAGKMNKGFVYAVRDSWSNDDIYGEPIWWPAWVAGWVEVAHSVPQFLKRAYKNQTTWKWHVQIPYSFWDKKFPEQNYEGDYKAREADINSYMDQIERNLLGAENAEKPIFSNYAVNEMNGRIEEEWKIEPLSNKYNAGQENLVTSAAANSEILFSLMVNPNVLGAGMPGGTYAGNQGGSNIREAFLVNIANAWIDRQNLLDPLELYIRLNGMPECHLRFRNTILTTLDTGAGTAHRLS